MDTKENESQIETVEELEAEKGQLTVPKEDELRSAIVSEYGFDPEADKERIDKLVAKELGHRTALSKTIGQKVKYRTDLQAMKANPPKPTETKVETKFDQKELDKHLNEAFEKRDLEAMEYPDDLKKVIQNIAKINGISVRQAVSDPYAQAKIEAWKKEKGADEASISRNNKNGGEASEQDYSVPPDVDLGTPEGRKKYDEWKKKAIDKEKSQFK